MYIRLSTRRTKAYYQEIMAQAMAETDHLRKMSPEVALYEVIYAQLMDLKEQVIDRGMVIPSSVLYKRYSLGTIAVKNWHYSRSSGNAIIDYGDEKWSRILTRCSQDHCG